MHSIYSTDGPPADAHFSNTHIVGIIHTNKYARFRRSVAGTNKKKY